TAVREGPRPGPAAPGRAAPRHRRLLHQPGLEPPRPGQAPSSDPGLAGALLGHEAGRLARAATGFDRALAWADHLPPRSGLVAAHARLKEAPTAWEHAEADALARSGELGRFRVLHLATHGRIDLDHLVRSALILAHDRLPAEAEQAERARKGQKVYTGELRVGTILGEWKGKLDADLVVLSACDTGLGRPTGGHGLLGFAHALQVAGARSVVLSRWKVDDRATALLMVRFYENLLGSRKGLGKPLGRAEALEEAKRWLRGLSRRELEP